MKVYDDIYIYILRYCALCHSVWYIYKYIYSGVCLAGALYFIRGIFIQNSPSQNPSLVWSYIYTYMYMIYIYVVYTLVWSSRQTSLYRLVFKDKQVLTESSTEFVYEKFVQIHGVLLNSNTGIMILFHSGFSN